MQKGSALLFVILVVLVLAGLGGGYAYLNYPNKPFSNLLPQITSQISNTDKIYQNPQLNFELTYPDKELTVREDSEQDFNKRGNGQFRKNFKGYVGYEPGKFSGAVVVLGKDNSYDTDPFTVWVFENEEDLSIEKWYDKYWYFPFVWGDFSSTGKLKTSPQQESTISGQIAKSAVIGYRDEKPKFIYLSKDKKMYLFRIIGESGEKILSTFKLLEQKESEVCIQVITPAKNSTTGECKEFPTPCDIPVGWVKVESCPL